MFQSDAKSLLRVPQRLASLEGFTRDLPSYPWLKQRINFSLQDRGALAVLPRASGSGRAAGDVSVPRATATRCVGDRAAPGVPS